MTFDPKYTPLLNLIDELNFDNDQDYKFRAFLFLFETRFKDIMNHTSLKTMVSFMRRHENMPEEEIVLLLREAFYVIGRRDLMVQLGGSVTYFEKDKFGKKLDPVRVFLYHVWSNITPVEEKRFMRKLESNTTYLDFLLQKDSRDPLKISDMKNILPSEITTIDGLYLEFCAKYPSKIDRPSPNCKKLDACSEDDLVEEYPHKNMFLGIINENNYDDKSKTRCGSEKDIEKLKSLQNYLKIFPQVFVFSDLNKEAFLTKLDFFQQELIKKKDTVDIFVLVIMGHGQSDGIETVDGYILDFEKDIKSKFSSQKCPGMADKPKLFFFQCCLSIPNTEQGPSNTNLQSDTSHSNLTTDAIMGQSHRMARIHDNVDMLTAYSTFKGDYSYRHLTEGCFFIKILCEEIIQRAKKMDIFGIMTSVNGRMIQTLSKYPYTTEVHTTLKHICKLPTK